MAWFKREKKGIDEATPPEERRVRTEGLWTKCENCRTTVWKKDLEANWRVCPKCQHHFRLNATQRLELLLDRGLHFLELLCGVPVDFDQVVDFFAEKKLCPSSLEKLAREALAAGANPA